MRPRRLLTVALALVSLGACAGILGLKPSGRRAFEHRAHVTNGVSCLRCHAGVQQAGEEGPPSFPDTARCLECHDRPHDRRECSSCHGLPLIREAAQDARHYLRFRHDTHLERTRGECMTCHLGVSTDDPVLRPTMATCLSCHAHREQFDVRACDACHQNLRAEHTKPRSHVVHEGDFLREHGVRAAASSDLCASCHAESFCASCHGATVPMLPETLAFDDPMRAGVHRAGFLARHSEQARTQPGLCTTCHTEDSCQACHQSRGVSPQVFGARSPHGPGWLGAPGQRNDHGRAAWRNPAECASCHGGAGEALCVSCHQVGGIGGSPHPMGWTSRLDATRDQPCRMCHRGGL